MIDGKADWTKAQWRNAARQARAGLSASENDHRIIISHFLKDIVSKYAPLVTSIYWPIGEEFDTKPLLKAMDEKGLGLALPRTTPGQRPMHFYSWNWGDPLETGAFNLCEPPEDSHRICQPSLIVMPLLAFDRAGTRLGYGMGHFDATMAQRKVPAIGLAYAEQEASHALPADPHDHKLDAVLTPQGVIWFK